MKEKTLAVQAMQDYILEHMAEEITLADLAGVASFSPWYAHRLFREMTGISPAEYIRKVSLTEAAKRLKSDKCRVTDLAMDYDYDTPESFTRAFSKFHGYTPTEA